MPQPRGISIEPVQTVPAAFAFSLEIFACSWESCTSAEVISIGPPKSRFTICTFRSFALPISWGPRNPEDAPLLKPDQIPAICRSIRAVPSGDDAHTGSPIIRPIRIAFASSISPSRVSLYPPRLIHPRIAGPPVRPSSTGPTSIRGPSGICISGFLT